jgi:signal transduction histidine kinase
MAETKATRRRLNSMITEVPYMGWPPEREEGPPRGATTRPWRMRQRALSLVVRVRREPTSAVVFSFLLTVAAFVASTLVATSWLSDVSRESGIIGSNAMPAVMALTTLRERLHELVSTVSTASDSGTTDVPNLEPTLEDIDRQLNTYASKAALSRQGDAWLRCLTLVDATIADARHARDELVAGHAHEARAFIDSDLRPKSSAAHAQIWRLVEYNAEEGEQFARRVDLRRRSSTILLLALDALCVALAVALTATASRAIKSRIRLAEARLQELELFSARVAHDIRGPLSPVVIALQRLDREIPLSDAHKTLLDRATRGVGRVGVLVDDLLAFARAAGRVDRSVRTRVLTILRGSVEEVAAPAASKAIDIVLDPRASDAVAACPPGVLTSLISNLLQNAIKYTAGSAVRRVVVRTVPTGDRLRVEVEDTGPGLPVDALEHVFEPYVRADRTGQPGLGLGLATVKRLADAYGGSAGVRANAGGCTFWFELPAELVATES